VFDGHVIINTTAWKELKKKNPTTLPQAPAVLVSTLKLYIQG